MKFYSSKLIGAAGLAGLLSFGAGYAVAQGQNTQSPPAQQQQQPQQQQPQQQQPDKNAQPPANNATGLTLDTAPPPASADEEAAFKAFDAVPGNDIQKKISAGEDFLQKYPESRYRPPVYSTLTIAYLQTRSEEHTSELQSHV